MEPFFLQSTCSENIMAKQKVFDPSAFGCGINSDSTVQNTAVIHIVHMISGCFVFSHKAITCPSRLVGWLHMQPSLAAGQFQEPVVYGPVTCSTCAAK